jgi:hypothetical protein
MPAGDTYRAKAVEISARAETEADHGIRLEMANLAKSYQRLADQADRNGENDIVYEALPPQRRTD